MQSNNDDLYQAVRDLPSQDLPNKLNPQTVWLFVMVEPNGVERVLTTTFGEEKPVQVPIIYVGEDTEKVRAMGQRLANTYGIRLTVLRFGDRRVQGLIAPQGAGDA